MSRTAPLKAFAQFAAFAVSIIYAGPAAMAGGTDTTWLPSGNTLSPIAAHGTALTNLPVRLPDGHTILLSHPATMAPGADGKRFYLLTSGFNRHAGLDGKLDPEASSEWLLAYDIVDGMPVQSAVTPVPNTFDGLALSKDGKHAYVTGGPNDNLHIFKLEANAITADGPPIPLGHKSGLGIEVKPAAGAIVLSPDEKQALVANYFNDSVSLVDLESRNVVAEQDLRPGAIDPKATGVAGGEYPVDVLWTDTGTGYVLSLRDRELIKLGIANGKITVVKRLSLPGQPARMVYDAPRSRIYVAVDTADLIAAVDIKKFALAGQLPIRLPNMPKAAEGKLGTGLNSLSLSPDGTHLWATLGALNAIAQIRLGDDDGDDDEIGMIEGVIPVGWYPTASLVTEKGHLFVTHGKSLPGANPGACRGNLSTDPVESSKCNINHQYVLQLEHGGIVSMPLPSPAELKRLSMKVASNNNLMPPKEHVANAALMKALSARIKHIIYIVKENRTYDQVLGDLPRGDGDPKLALLAPFSPNHKAIAQNFVILDRAFASGEVSNTGWMWSTAAHVTDALERTSPVNYAQRGLDYGSEGMNRNINVGVGNIGERRKTNPNHPDDPNLLPGTGDTSAPDAKIGEAGTSFLWTSVRRAGLSVRNYGFFVDDQIYRRDRPGYLAISHHPFADKAQQSVATHADLADVTDIYFRSFDQDTPDYWRYLEWQREFDQYEARGVLPNLTLLRLSHDHFGSFATAQDGVNTIETQMADNDYAVGLVVERIARSRFKNSTLIVSIEDDAQNGADHVDARRTVVLVAGPYVRQKVVVSERYSTVNLLRTITDILGAEPVGLQAALAEPMAKVFDLNQKVWEYKSIVPEVLRQTDLPVPGGKQTRVWSCPVHDARYWAEAMKGQDFSSEDRLDSAAFNRALEAGLAPVRLNPACAGLASR